MEGGFSISFHICIREFNVKIIYWHVYILRISCVYLHAFYFLQLTAEQLGPQKNEMNEKGILWGKGETKASGDPHR